MNTDTPETNSAFKFWPCEQIELVDAEFARRLERERDEALQWKKGMLLVDKQWDEQAVGRLLGLRLGDSIKANIEPKLRQLIRERNKYRDAILATLEENRHLADGEDCTLAKLKSAIPDWK